jgi:hypothetical protein
MSAPVILDIGGEGRHRAAWNLNPRVRRTFGPRRGEVIPRLIRGRGESIPLADGTVDVLFVERTPLRSQTLREILRVAKPRARIILRHADSPLGDPHRRALDLLGGQVTHSTTTIHGRPVRQTVVRL